MSDSESQILQQAVTALEYHEEELIAEQLRQHAAEPDHPRLKKISWGVKAVTLWATILGSVVVGIGGMAYSTLQGELFNAAFFLAFTFIVWAAMMVLNAVSEGIRDWFAENEWGDA